MQAPEDERGDTQDKKGVALVPCSGFRAWN